MFVSSSVQSLVAAAALLVLPAAAQSQSHPMTGKWAVEYAAGMRVENDVPTPIMAKASLTVEAVGDSLIATLVTEPTADLPPRPPVRLATRRADGKVAFVQRTTLRMNRDGEESSHPATITWQFEVSGDAISGTIERKVEGMELPVGVPGALKGTRVKG